MSSFLIHSGCSHILSLGTLVLASNPLETVWETAIGRAGIPWATPHSLRHTSITEAVHVPNSNVVDISRVAGHKNLKTTQRYIHTADEGAHAQWQTCQKLATFEN